MGTRSHRLLAACALSGLAGCATTVPIQTASPVPVGTVRASGQASLGVYCGFADLDRCAFGGSTPSSASRCAPACTTVWTSAARRTSSAS